MALLLNANNGDRTGNIKGRIALWSGKVVIETAVNNGSTLIIHIPEKAKNIEPSIKPIS